MRPGEMAFLAVTTRARDAGQEQRVESRHAGHLAVVGPDRRVAATLGVPDRVTFLRSAVKPFQAAACLALLEDDLPDDLVAVAWSSHRGERVHLDAVGRILDLVAVAPDALTTPPARPLDDPTAPESRIAHNCSGKHALFALAGTRVGVRGPRLLDPDGPLQAQVLDVLDDAVGDIAAIAVDGCGAPAVAAPLSGLARAFADLADPRGRWTRVVAAGFAQPHLVGGTGRLETALLDAGVVAKPGAEGVFGAGWRDRRGDTWGLACKVEDGASRAASVAVHAFLAEAGVVDTDIWRPPPVLGGGAPVGRVRAAAPVPALARSLRV